MLFSHVCNARNMTGAEKLLLFLVRKLNVHFECILIVPQEGKLARMARMSGIRTKICRNPLLFEMCEPFAGLKEKAEMLARSEDAKAILALIEQESCDYVFVNTCVNVVPAMLAKQLGIPVIWHITETVPDLPYRELTVEMVHMYSDHIVGISEAVLSPYRIEAMPHKASLLYPSWEDHEYHPERWNVLRPTKRKEWGVDDSQTVIGYISSFLIAQKGPEHFIEAAIKLNKQHKKLKFVVIGGEIDRLFYRHLKRRVREAECGKQFIFIDYEDEIEAAYCAMDIVVVPSLLSEGFGMTAMEAMIFGKPVVSYAAGGLCEILEKACSSECLVAVGDKEQLQAKISSLVEAPEVAKQIGQVNRECVLSVFGPQGYEHRLHQLVATISTLTRAPIPNPAPTPIVKEKEVQNDELTVISSVTTERKPATKKRKTSPHRRTRKSKSKIKSKARTSYKKRTVKSNTVSKKGKKRSSRKGKITKKSTSSTKKVKKGKVKRRARKKK